MLASICFYTIKQKFIILLRVNKTYFAAISGGAHGEVQPDGAVAITLYHQLVKLLLALIGIVKEYRGVTKQLLHARHFDIHRTPSKMVRRSHAPNLPIELRAAIPAVDPDGFLEIFIHHVIIQGVLARKRPQKYKKSLK